MHEFIKVKNYDYAGSYPRWKTVFAYLLLASLIFSYAYLCKENYNYSWGLTWTQLSLALMTTFVVEFLLGFIKCFFVGRMFKWAMKSPDDHLFFLRNFPRFVS